MCGIAGIVDLKGEARPRLKSRLGAMSRLIAHRGPDGAGLWQSARGQAGLGHRRLAIIDLSEEARQPMEGVNGTAIAFNGEIYNYVELREELASGWSFGSHSDTECILAGFAPWGPDRSEERPGGEEGVGRFGSRWYPGP